MYEVKVELIICSIDYVNGDLLVFSISETKFELPQVVLADQNLLDTAKDLFTTYCDLSLNWANLFQAQTIKSDNSLIVQYAVIVPSDTEFKCGSFFPVTETANKELLDILTNIMVKL